MKTFGVLFLALATCLPLGELWGEMPPAPANEDIIVPSLVPQPTEMVEPILPLAPTLPSDLAPTVVLPPSVLSPAVPVEPQPNDFLEAVSQQAKARWRMLYREPASSPSIQRFQVAFNLGGIIADGCLALQAKDAQQFRNVNQDALKYVASLALTERVSPMLMAESKMAEDGDWDKLRPRLMEKRDLIEQLLIDLRDEDLAILVRLGMWMRIFEITSSVVQADATVENKQLCIGSAQLLNALCLRYEQLSRSTQGDQSVLLLGNTLQFLQKHWNATENQAEAPQSLVDTTLEKVRFTLSKFSPKSS